MCHDLDRGELAIAPWEGIITDNILYEFCAWLAKLHFPQQYSFAPDANAGGGTRWHLRLKRGLSNARLM
jgi:hypothetical protein